MIGSSTGRTASGGSSSFTSFAGSGGSGTGGNGSPRGGGGGAGGAGGRCGAQAERSATDETKAIRRRLGVGRLVMAGPRARGVQSYND
jgi:hypothetical protein